MGSFASALGFGIPLFLPKSLKRRPNLFAMPPKRRKSPPLRRLLRLREKRLCLRRLGSKRRLRRLCFLRLRRAWRSRLRICPSLKLRPLNRTLKPPPLRLILRDRPFIRRRSILQQLVIVLQYLLYQTCRELPGIFFHFLPKRTWRPLPRRSISRYFFLSFKYHCRPRRTAG